MSGTYRLLPTHSHVAFVAMQQDITWHAPRRDQTQMFLVNIKIITKCKIEVKYLFITLSIYIYVTNYNDDITINRSNRNDEIHDENMMVYPFRYA